MSLAAPALWLATINAITFAAFAWDKYRARRGAWRVPESRLLFLALIGGWPAAKLAQRTLRHKTRKMPFARSLNLILPVQFALVALWIACVS